MTSGLSRAVAYRAGYVLWATAFLAWSTAYGAESDGQLWATGRVNVPIGERLALSMFAQGRIADDISASDVWLLRPAIGYRVWESVWLGAGYDYFRLIDRGDEHRFWQEVALPFQFGDFVMSNRVRVEERWISDLDGVLVRARYRNRCAHPLAETPLYLVFANEVFVNINDLGSGPQHGFEQNRLAGGVGVHLGSLLRSEVGYQWRYLDRRGPDRNDHILTISFFLDTRGKPKQVPTPEEGHH
ncbi:MAG: DUF2490 domain-containing protein [Myxococcota bacterium]